MPERKDEEIMREMHDAVGQYPSSDAKMQVLVLEVLLNIRQILIDKRNETHSAKRAG